MSGRAELFKLLGGEDVNGNQMDLGVTVLAGLGGGHLDNLAWAVLDDDETVLPQSRALHGVGRRGAGIGALEGVLMLHIEVSIGLRAHCGQRDVCAQKAAASRKGGVEPHAEVMKNIPARRRPW